MWGDEWYTWLQGSISCGGLNHSSVWCIPSGDGKASETLHTSFCKSFRDIRETNISYDITNPTRYLKCYITISMLPKVKKINGHLQILLKISIQIFFPFRFQFFFGVNSDPDSKLKSQFYWLFNLIYRHSNSVFNAFTNTISMCVQTTALRTDSHLSIFKTYKVSTVVQRYPC